MSEFLFYDNIENYLTEEERRGIQEKPKVEASIQARWIPKINPKYRQGSNEPKKINKRILNVGFYNVPAEIVDVLDKELGIKPNAEYPSEDKKTYNIKLSAAMRVLGMESGSKWALLANHFDKTLIRNELAFYLAAEAGGYAAPDSRFAEVYLNGKLIGSYLVCEPVTDGKHRADIDTEAGDFIAERVKAWAPGAQDTVTTRELGVRFDIEYAADIKKARSVLNAAEQAILSGDEERIRECIDVDSFAAMYVVH